MSLVKNVIKSLVFILAVLVLSLPVGACTPTVQALSGVMLYGTGDLYYLSVAINEYSKTNSGLPQVQMHPGIVKLADIKSGRYNALLVGRKPTPEELLGMKDFLIAYDAVCIIIDQNSYLGGEYWSSAKTPVRKTSGLRDLTSEDIKGIYSSEPGGAWLWHGEHYKWEPIFDTEKNDYAKNAKTWKLVNQMIGLRFVFPPGKFDTQYVLYQNLGLNEETLTVKWKKLPIDEEFFLEEQVLSSEYSGSLYYASKYGSQDFKFKLGFASRRVMTIAPQHVPVEIVAVDGMNPLINPEYIYNETYPFSREIHLLIPENSPDIVLQLADFLQSPSGQKMIAEAGYLPVLWSR